MSELADSLRAWRDRLDPADAGLPRQALRRAPGLRREEVAALAGVSVHYLTRLEQGRATPPSASVVASLARALRLPDPERDHLHRLAGLAAPGAGTMSRHLTPSIQRLLDRLADVPVLVKDAAWDVVALNAPGTALLGDLTSARGRERNIAWREFFDLPMRVLHDERGQEAFRDHIVCDLRAALAVHHDDAPLRALVADLRAHSPEFERRWEHCPGRPVAARRKVVEHPEAGRLTLDCDVLTVGGSDLQIVVYTAEPGTPDASALQLVGVLGLERFAAS